jgi:NADH-quinone oxidoreductase subunit D
MHKSEHTDTGEKFIIPIGPQHPALKEPGHFEFTVDGEIVTAASVRLGYAHRGIEKGTESRNWVQNLYLLERICGICSHVHATAYCLGVEQLAGVEAPPRAQAIRELVAELERIHSHLLWLGVAAHEAGFDTLFMYAWRDRETVMDILEGLTGNRVNYSANVLGGVKYDVDAAQTKAIHEGLDFLEGRTRHYLDVVTSDPVFVQRTRGIGVMTAEQATKLGVIGPTARASGVARDIRVEAPYVAYADFPVTPVLDSAGDLEARFVVRLKELFESYRIIRQIVENLPAGELTVQRMPRRIKPGEVISRVEAPRGELFYFIKSNGTDMPERIKVRTPTLCNMASVLTLTVGHHLADVPMILVGIDPCFSCNDRGVILQQGDGHDHWTWERLRQFGIDYYAGGKQAGEQRREGAEETQSPLLKDKQS